MYNIYIYIYIYIYTHISKHVLLKTVEYFLLSYHDTLASKPSLTLKLSSDEGFLDPSVVFF